MRFRMFQYFENTPTDLAEKRNVFQIGKSPAYIRWIDSHYCSRFVDVYMPVRIGHVRIVGKNQTEKDFGR